MSKKNWLIERVTLSRAFAGWSESSEVRVDLGYFTAKYLADRFCQEKNDMIEDALGGVISPIFYRPVAVNIHREAPTKT